MTSYFLAQKALSENRVYPKRKEWAPLENNVFPVRLDPFFEDK